MRRKSAFGESARFFGTDFAREDPSNVPIYIGKESTPRGLSETSVRFLGFPAVFKAPPGRKSLNTKKKIVSEYQIAFFSKSEPNDLENYAT
jgi:hypothetical protein